MRVSCSELASRVVAFAKIKMGEPPMSDLRVDKEDRTWKPSALGRGLQRGSSSKDPGKVGSCSSFPLADCTPMGRSQNYRACRQSSHNNIF